MSEINTNFPTVPITAENPNKGEPTNAEVNRMPGLGSGLDTKGIIESLVRVEQRRTRPVEVRKFDTQKELDSYNMVKTALEAFKTDATPLATSSIWEGKIVESSDEDVVRAFGTSGAKPGKHTLIVDKLALNHQIASQGFKEKDDLLGKGTFKITVGESDTITVEVNETNNTLTGLKNAIDTATNKVDATIIKTGSQDRPYQLVLTSQTTGSAGKITLDIQLKDGAVPNFSNLVEEPSDWFGVEVEEEEEVEKKPEDLKPIGASTTIIKVTGDYLAEEDKDFRFTAVQSGKVGGETPLQIRWSDSTGREGVLELDKYNYSPGQPLEFVDGLSLVIGDGEIVVGDDFSFKARAKRSDLVWWVSPEDREAGYTQPTPWKRQATFGKPVVEGAYQGAEEAEFTMKVEGNGQIGSAENLKIHWESSLGDKGTVNIGKGYKPESYLALSKGLTLRLNPGVLNNGQTATFKAVPQGITKQWWLEDSERVLPARIEDVTAFSGGEEEKEEEEKFGIEPIAKEKKEKKGPEKSTSAVTISGSYSGDESRLYTFTALKDGTVGTTGNMKLDWVSDKGDKGTLVLDENYVPGTPIAFNSGLSIAFGEGRIVKKDFFTVRTHTSTIQPAQDAEIRFGATELGGGLTITNSTNEFSDVIEGVKLNLVSSSEKPVTITIRGDIEQARESVMGFVEQFNTLIYLINELTKFDIENNVAGPLLGDRDLTQIRGDLTNEMINPVVGLRKDMNMVIHMGLKLDDKGLLKVDEELINKLVNEDFAGVSNLFRNRGESDNQGVIFIRMDEDTQPSEDGYEINVTKPATRGFYQTPALPPMVFIGENNNRFKIKVNGLESDEIKLESGMIPLDEYARVLQNKITSDERVGKQPVRVQLEGTQIKVISGRYGDRSSIGFEKSGNNEEETLPPGMSAGTSEEGHAVAGTIDGEEAEGLGEVLKASDKSKRAKGLRVLVKLTENMINKNGPEAKIKITKGIASKVEKYIKDLLDKQGSFTRITGGLRDQIDNIDKQLVGMNERIERKRVRLVEKFSKLEGQMGALKSQQQYMASQLGSLPGGGALPGLPKK